MTVPELATRLEASQRTVRRDLDSLSMAGVPVYSQRGRGGGWRLLGGHRIDLSGLTADEAQALLLATDPGAAALGPELAQGLAAARRKVVAALPEPMRSQVEAAAATVLVDPSGWGRRAEDPTRTSGGGPGGRAEGGHLLALRAAVRTGMQVDVDYEPPGRPAEARRLHPHGLVCKRGVWYLVATTAAGRRTYRVSRVRAVRPTEDRAERPEGFDLAAAWDEIQDELRSRAPSPVVVEAEVSAGSLRRLRATVGSWWPVEEGPADCRGPVPVTMRFPTVDLAAAELVGLGDQIHVRSPAAVRDALAGIGEHLVARYRRHAAG